MSVIFNYEYTIRIISLSLGIPSPLPSSAYRRVIIALWLRYLFAIALNAIQK